MTKRQVAQHKPGTAMRIGGPLPLAKRAKAEGGLAGLLAGVSMSAAALALAAIPQQARAQSAVNATPTGTNAIVTQSATFDQVTVSGSQATVDWALNPTGVSTGVFLNGGTQLDFQGSGSYTVLNRVNPMTLTGTLALNGSVTSNVGGKIWFYNPGGWVVGSGANIDVGSLVLTSSPITESAFDSDDASNTGLYGPGGTIRFGQALAGSSVSVDSEASIRAEQNNSYVALVAPRVVQAGTVSTNGVTAYVAVGVADIKIDNGLFDIVVTSGTDDPNGVVHTRSTARYDTGSSSAGPQGIYLVAVPKNDALTMLVSGNLGYNSASSAAQIGGKIVLSAGYGVSGGEIDTPQRVAGGSITITGGNFSSSTQGTASDAIDVIADNGGGFAGFGADLSLAADNRIGLLAQGGESSIDVAGNLVLAAGRGAIGGAIAVTVASGAGLFVGGDFDAHADGIGAIQSDGEVLTAGAAGEAATGGSVKITLGDATYAVGGQTSLSANAIGGLGGASAGSARAGSVSFSTVALTTLSPNTPLDLQASANAFTPQFGDDPTTGASAIGGSVDLAFGGSFEADSISASSTAVANRGQDGAAQNATGGSISLALSGSGKTVNVAGIDLTAGATAGNAGTASGATVLFKVDGATLTGPQSSGECDGPCDPLDASITIDTFRNGAGSAAGSVGFSVVNGGTLDLAGAFSSIDLFSNARALSGGSGIGTAISFTVDGGTVNVPSFSIESDGSGASDGPLSNGRGGDITVTLRNGGSINASSDFSLYSSGTGGNGLAAGDGTGGTVLLSIANGSLNSPFVNLTSVGFAGNQFTSGTRIGTGFGGSAAINLTNSAAALTADIVSVRAPGQSGQRGGAIAAFGPVVIGGTSGGNGEGGIASITVDDGFLSANDTLTIDASGEGGDGFGGGTGGSGTGGTASLTVNGGTVSPVNLEIGADGRGGFGASNDTEGNTPAAAGGAGTGGNASLLQTGGNLTTSSISLTATGNASKTIFFGEEGSFTTEYGGGGTVFGNGPATGGTGGAGEGGDTSLTITGGSLANISGAPVRSISLDSRGVGGMGGDAESNSNGSQLTRGSGGEGRGGTSTFSLNGGSADFESVSLDASGSGGLSGQEVGDVSGTPSNGGDGGSAIGGIASITLGSPLSALTNFESTRSYSASAGGQGANGGDGLVGGAGGSGRGGSATLTVTSPDVFANQIDLDAFGNGGNGGSSGLGNDGGSGGDGTGGTTQLLADGAGVTFAPVNGSLYVSGQGGNGGTGGSGESEGLDAAGDGGTAGAGSGGTVRVSASNGATLDFTQTSEFEASGDGFGGFGGDGGNAGINLGTAIGDGGNGGDGTGGSFELSAQDGALLLGAFSVGADGTGGNGGGRLIARSSSTDASTGGSGGNGFGGNVGFTATGSAGSIQADSLDVHVDGFGGGGIDGQGYDPVTFVGANGGAGQAGTGGTIRLDAFDGGTISVTGDSLSTLNANGTAAFGGVGANGATNPATGVGGTGGTGGNSGQGNGGTVTLNAEGGLIQTGDLSVFVNGYGASGSQGGAGGVGMAPLGSPVGTPAAANGAAGASGNAGGGLGGVVEITAFTGLGETQGGLEFGAVNIDLRSYVSDGDFSSPGVAGAARIEDRVDEGKGGVGFASLNVDAQGIDGFDNSSLFISSRSAPIRVTGDLTASTAGYIDIEAYDTGGLDVDGTLNLRTDSTIALISFGGGLIRANDIFLSAASQISVTAVDCAGPLCPVVHADNTFDAFAGDDFALIGPALASASGELRVRSEANVIGDAGSGFAGPSISVSAAHDVTVRNAQGGTVHADAGLISFGEGASFVNGNLTLGEADGSGVFDLSGGLYGAAGTSIDVLGGTTIESGNAIELVAGDDIRIGAGASLTNTTGGSEAGFIRIDAGGLATDGSYPAGSVASLLIGNGAIIDGTGGSVTLSGGAIDGRGATFRGADFTADVVSPPAAGVAQRTDNGQLTALCLEGDICLGAIAATGAVQIGQGDSAPIGFTGTGNISGASVAITSRNSLTYGAAASPFTIAVTGPVVLTSQTGDIALTGNALVNGGTVALSAAGSITGNGRLNGTGDIGIDVGANITLASLVTGRQLTTVAGIGGALEPVYTVPGNLSIGTFQVAAPTVIRAGGSIVIDSATTAGKDLDLFASSLISLGADSNVANLTLVGRDVAFATIDATGNIVLSAGNTIAGTSATAGGALTASGTTLNAMALQSGGAMSLTTTGVTTVGQLRAATDVTAQATTLTFGGITAGRDVTLDVTTLGGTAIDAGRDLTIRSVNDLTFGTIAAGRNLSLDASQGAITVNSDIDAGGTVSLVGDAILVRAVGPLTVATVTADNGDIAITTDGLLRVSNAVSRGDATLTSTASSLILGPIVAGRALATPQALNPSGTSKGTPGPGTITLSAAQSITMQGTVDALTALAATAGTLIDQRSLAVGKTIAYRSADLTLGQTAALGQSNFTTSIALSNTGSAGALLGDVAGTTAGYRLDNAEFGRIHSGGDVSLAAGSSLTVGTLSASAASGSNGVADGNIGATSTLALSTSGDLAVGGTLALGNAAGNTLRLTSGSLTLDAGAGSVRLVEGTGHGGTLAISTGELSALTSAARTAIVGMDGNAINLRLAQNDGVSDGRTLLEAGAISIAASGRVLIQNTALGQTFDARRGFVADTFAIGTGGTTSGSTTGSPTETTGRPLIVINGTVAGQTGLTALRAVSVTGGFDDLSTVNGCRLFTATCGTPQFDPLRDLIEDEIGRGSNLDSGDAIGEGMLILIDRFEPLGFEAVIDEPVTGSGNDDFLVPEAGTGDQECTADDNTKCDKPPAG